MDSTNDENGNQGTTQMEDILFCIIIIITPSRDVVPPIRDAIDVFGHVKPWGKTFVVTLVSSTDKSIIEMYF